MINKKRASYKPFELPWCFEAYQMLLQQHWIPETVPMSKDIEEWKNVLTEAERHTLTDVQLYLSSADTDIAAYYVDKIMPKLRLPEIRMMLISIADQECIHQHSYSYTIDSLAMDESVYSRFLEVPAMWEKHVFITQPRFECNTTGVQDFLLDLAIGSAFGEGIQLFSAFAIILSFMKRGLMTGLGQLTTYIARDEDLHCTLMTKLFDSVVESVRAGGFDPLTPEMKDRMLKACWEAVRLEDHFIDLAFADIDLPNLAIEDVKAYIRYIANKRLIRLGLEPYYIAPVNPLPWMDELLRLNEHGNFFEVHSTSYSLNNASGQYNEDYQ